VRPIGERPGLVSPAVRARPVASPSTLLDAIQPMAAGIALVLAWCNAAAQMSNVELI